MRRIWPPEPATEDAIVVSDIPYLREWCTYFEVNFGDDAAADRFARNYGLRFPRSGGTVRGAVAWLTLRIGAADEQEAAALAALTVKIATDVKPATAIPDGAVLHHVDPIEPGFEANQEELREERAAMVRYADALGIKRRLVGGRRRPPKPSVLDAGARGRPALDSGA